MTTTPIDLPALAVGARVQDTLLVWEVESRSQGDGSRFVILTLSNASGRLKSAPFWSSELHKVEGLVRGAIVRVTGEISEYRGDRQLKVVSIDPVPPGGADLARLVPSVGDVAKYWTTLDKWRAEMKEGPWKRAVDAFYEDPDFRRAYEQCPGSTGNHHAALGGLLKHTVEVGAIARTIAKTARRTPTSCSRACSCTTSGRWTPTGGRGSSRSPTPATSSDTSPSARGSSTAGSASWSRR